MKMVVKLPLLRFHCVFVLFSLVFVPSSAFVAEFEEEEEDSKNTFLRRSDGFNDDDENDDAKGRRQSFLGGSSSSSSSNAADVGNRARWLFERSGNVRWSLKNEDDDEETTKSFSLKDVIGARYSDDRRGPAMEVYESTGEFVTMELVFSRTKNKNRATRRSLVNVGGKGAEVGRYFSGDGRIKAVTTSSSVSSSVFALREDGEVLGYDEEKPGNVKNITKPFQESVSVHCAKSKEVFTLFHVNRESSEHQKENSFDIAPRQKINIGYFSADFCEHAVSNQLSEILKMHDKNKFNTFGFYLGTKIDNKLREIKKNFNDFFYISQIETRNIIQLVKNLKIDIAVDLMGYTKSNRYKIFNERCAPIQVSYLGYAGTTGLKNMDYLIADESVILNDYRKYYLEKIIYMPNSFMPNNENQIISEKKYTKMSEGLPKNGIVYCCFNKHYKITPKIFDVWIDILKNVENSILWLNSAEEDTKKNILEYSRQKGLSQKKIFFTERTLGYPEYLSKHQLADIFLDTSPFSAHSTGCASLLAGVPIITISGKSYANNVCSSLLRSIGMGELIAENLTEYKDKAIYLGKNLDKLLNIKKKIKNNNMGKSLFDSKTYTKDLEKAFSQIYKTKKNKLQNEDLRVNQL